MVSSNRAAAQKEKRMNDIDDIMDAMATEGSIEDFDMDASTAAIENLDIVIPDEDTDAVEMTDAEMEAEDAAIRAEINAELRRTGQSVVDDECDLITKQVAADVVVAKKSAKKAKAKAPKAKVAKTDRGRKPKMNLEDTTKMRDILVDATSKEADLTVVKRCIFMQALEPVFSLRDIYRETVHPRFKATVRGCYNAAAIIESLTAQIMILNGKG